MLINSAVELGLIEKGSQYAVSDRGNKLLTELNMISVITQFYEDQYDTTANVLLIFILTDDEILRRLNSYNEKQDLKIPLEALLGTVVVYHELRK